MPKYTNAEFIKAWYDNNCSPEMIARELKINVRSVYQRRRSIENTTGVILKTISYNPAYATKITIPENNVQIELNTENAVFVVGSDAHYWGEITPGHKAFVAVINYLKPDFVVLNGDIFDGAAVSRHPKIGWERRPTVKQELEAVQARLGEIEKISGNAKLIRTIGNHDLRFESRLASLVPEFEGIGGMTLQDHLPGWKPCWAIMVNKICQIKHRLYNGVHAAYNNTLKSGVSVVTGHLHSLKVTPWTDLKGDRYGVDTGTLADPWSDQFLYMEASTRNWRAGFAVLTFKDGNLLPPELVHIISPTEAYFRGQVFELNR